MINQDTILQACKAHGAQAVMQAAEKAYSGDHGHALQAVGLTIANMGDAHQIHSYAFRLLDPDERAADLADAAIKAANL